MVSDPMTHSARRSASAKQLRAVYSVMRILADEDRERGTPPESRISCVACRRGRPAVGSISYSGTRLCNGCATDYELLRMAGIVPDLAAFLRQGTAATTAG